MADKFCLDSEQTYYTALDRITQPVAAAERAAGGPYSPEGLDSLRKQLGCGTLFEAAQVLATRRDQLTATAFMLQAANPQGNQRYDAHRVLSDALLIFAAVTEEHIGMLAEAPASPLSIQEAVDNLTEKASQAKRTANAVFFRP